ncbi:enoyl-CoA hydratase/isomerase family protein [Microbacterium sp. RD1]|uniref:enoyl-CoA hydratase/isomerase family protein n=1 Tax=Microbacterium sp. RD1 TaxID=3457313 RepID=UPI003FA5AE4A
MSDPRVHVDIDRAAHLARITVDRPERSNMIDPAMVAAIVAAIDRVEDDDELKAVVIRGAGDHLSAGWDPEHAWSMYTDAPGGSVKKHPSQRARLTALADLWWGPRGMYTRVLKCRKVTIVEATGDCFDTGLYLTLCADLVVASDDARFAGPRWRNVGADGDMSLLIAEVGLKRAKDLLFLGRSWSAQQALDYGLVDVVGSRSEVAERSADLAQMCASIMRDGIVSEKYAVFASLAKMGVDLSFAATTVVAASLSNIHFQPGEFNFLREVGVAGADKALEVSRADL